MYNFQDIYPRAKGGALKWEKMYQHNPELGEEVIPFSVADMEFATPPEVIEGLKRYMDEIPVFGYTGPTQSYYDAVIGWMRRRHGWEIEKDWIFPTAGVVPALYLAVNAFTRPEDGVIIMPPVYGPFHRAVTQNGRKLVESPLIENREQHSYEIDFDDLARKAADKNNKMLILCSPHNPVGRVWKREELARVAEICLQNDVLVLSDEIHFDIILPGYQHTVFAQLGEAVQNNCVVCTAPSKTFNTAGLQTSNIVIPNPVLRQQFAEQFGRMGNFSLNCLGYRSCELAYNCCEEWLEQMLSHIESNRKLVEDFLAAELPQLHPYRLEGTYLLWIDCRDLGLDAQALENLMQDKAQFYCDEGYIFGEGGTGFERINLACPPRYLEAALHRLKAAAAACGSH